MDEPNKDINDQLASLKLQVVDEQVQQADAVAPVLGDWDADNGEDADDWDAAPLPQFRHATAASAPAAAPSPPASQAAAEAGSEREPDADVAPDHTPTPLREIAFEGGHLLEFHGLTSIVTSTDLEAWLQTVDTGRLPALVRWVDEENALAVFSDPAAAQAALRQAGKFKVRPFAKASPVARCMAAKQLAPPAPRPKTSAAVASRLIGSALGVRGMRDKAGEAELAAKRKEQADQRRQRQAQLAAAWDDV